MVDTWAPKGFVVSFKVSRIFIFLNGSLTHVQLETDITLLIPKARKALDRYGHQVVIGNELHRRKHKVVFVSRVAKQGVVERRGPGAVTQLEYEYTEDWLRIQEGQGEIEEKIVALLVQKHASYIAGGE